MEKSAFDRVMGYQQREPCVGCDVTTNYVYRKTGDPLCESCLIYWLKLRQIGWTGQPVDLADVGRVQVPAWMLGNRKRLRDDDPDRLS